MDLTSILTYLGANTGAVIAGFLFWWTLQNMQPLDHIKKRPEQLSVVIILSILLTPIGATIVSLFVRSRRLVQDIKKSN